MINTTVELLALRTPISNGALNADKLPERLKLLGWGENKSVKGPVRVSQLSASVLPGNQTGRGFDEIALDFEHNTVPGSPEFERSQEPRKVAAYGTPRIVPGEGLVLENIRWTPAGKTEALNFADLSPAVEMDSAGNIIFVHSAALTRNGAVEGLSFFSVQLKPQHQMNPDNILLVSDLNPLLGLSATATKAELIGKLGAVILLSSLATVKDGKITALCGAEIKEGKLILFSSAEEIEKRLKAIEQANNEKVVTLSAVVEGKTITLKPEDLVTKIVTLENFTAASTAAAETKDRETLIARFSAEGKVPKGSDGKELTNEQLKTFNVDSLKLLLANTPATVPLSARGKKPNETKGAAGELKGLEKAIALHTAGQ